MEVELLHMFHVQAMVTISCGPSVLFAYIRDNGIRINLSIWRPMRPKIVMVMVVRVQLKELRMIGDDTESILVFRGEPYTTVRD